MRADALSLSARRVKVYFIQPELILSILAVTRNICIISKLPDDATYVTSFHSPDSDLLGLVVESSSFDLVGPMEEIPVGEAAAVFHVIKQTDINQ